MIYCFIKIQFNKKTIKTITPKLTHNSVITAYLKIPYIPKYETNDVCSNSVMILNTSQRANIYVKIFTPTLA